MSNFSSNCGILLKGYFSMTFFLIQDVFWPLVFQLRDLNSLNCTKKHLAIQFPEFIFVHYRIEKKICFKFSHQFWHGYIWVNPQLNWLMILDYNIWPKVLSFLLEMIPTDVFFDGNSICSRIRNFGDLSAKITKSIIEYMLFAMITMLNGIIVHQFNL